MLAIQFPVHFLTVDRFCMFSIVVEPTSTHCLLTVKVMNQT